MADSVVAAAEVVVACPVSAMDTQAVLLAGEAAAAAAVVVAVKSTLPTFVYSGPNVHHGMSSTNPRLASIYCRLAGSQGSLPASRQVIAISSRDIISLTSHHC